MAWEYRIEKIADDETGIDDSTEMLNLWGGVGWELIGLFEKAGSNRWFVFKRLKTIDVDLFEERKKLQKFYGDETLR